MRDWVGAMHLGESPGRKVFFDNPELRKSRPFKSEWAMREYARYLWDIYLGPCYIPRKLAMAPVSLRCDYGNFLLIRYGNF